VFHRKYAEGRVRDLARTEQGRETLQRRIDWMLPEVLMWFGPSSEPGVAALKAQGLVKLDNDEMREAFQTDVFSILEENGLRVEVGELPWERWNSLQRRVE
ncbi:MAG: phenylacetate-CoA oxygenase subunit PaaI, partial [Solirubrobacterales bacterium]|nr:phenylacetate-CoA oxygenase subunit PaaI [Solirubrobacterales bacterium]